MEGFESTIAALDAILNTARKRHITGGILLSISMMFGGLALTTMTIKNDSDKETHNEIQCR